jgi:hypothetical protein
MNYETCTGGTRSSDWKRNLRHSTLFCAAAGAMALSQMKGRKRGVLIDVCGHLIEGERLIGFLARGSF